ncbi:MAG: filamentous hemagglutinin N-terminal domain-containing protein, partial [Desulfobacterales bacterium]
MNSIYRIIFNFVKSLWQVAAVIGGIYGISKNRRLCRVGAITGALLLTPVALLAAELPEGGTVSAGDATIQRSGDKLLIEQGGQKLAIDWDSFSIGPDGTVRFDQPGGGSIALNRVTGDQISRIRGELTANGGVFLLNPNGIVFGAEAQVDVGALVASTRGLSNEDFLNGDYTFTGSSSGAVINRGTIRARDGGYVALVAAEIVNTGSITADEGAVLAGAGDRVTLDLGGPVNIEVDKGALEARIEQGGVVQADGGHIHMTAEAADELSSSVINHDGISRARTLETGEDGSIVLKGDMETGTTEVAGTLDASAPDGGDGGFIETSAAKVNIDPDATITTEAPAGETGLWLIDPTDFYIAESGGDMTGEQLGTDLESTDVEINTDGNGGDGDIFVNDTVTWDANTLTLSAHRNIEINEHLDASGGGDLTLKYDQSDSGDGAYVVNATNGYQDTVDADRDYHGKVSLDSGSTFKTQDGPDSANEVTYTVITELGEEGSLTETDLQGMNGDRSGNYVLGADIDASATLGWNSDEGFAPVGDGPLGGDNKFTGTFDGLGHTISDLIIERPGSDYQGLFGYTEGATIRNVGLEGGSVTGDSYVGGLVGHNYYHSEVSNSYATGDVTGTEYIGGLVGFNEIGSTVSNSYATGDVTGTEDVGGLVGSNYTASTVSNS